MRFLVRKVVRKLGLYKDRVLKALVHKMIFQNPKYSLNLVSFFESTKNLQYVVTKLDTPYMPEDFPMSYPIGKDMDLLCRQGDFEELNHEILKFSELYKGVFNVRVMESDNNLRVRFEYMGILHYQIDNHCANDFDAIIIDNRVEHGLFMVPRIEHEIIIRLEEFKSNSIKKHHKRFIESNLEAVDLELVKEAGLFNTYNEIFNR